MTATTPTPTAVERPLEHADGLELIGEFKHSGFKEPPSIVRTASGQTVQLTELLFVVLSSIDGQRDLEQIASEVSQRIGKTATADNIKYLAEEKLRPLGLLKQPDGSNPPLTKSDPLLSIRGRFTLFSERMTKALTSPFRVLFFPPIVVAVIVAFAASIWWLFFDEGLGRATRQLLYSPSMLVLMFALTALSAGFHEFGHAAACRYGGAKPGVIGAGIYLVWPAFYTDVTDSYRLSRGGRLRTDLGGLYFNMLFALATMGVWALTHYAPLLILVPVQIVEMTHQLMPFIRLDGYYILSDLTGVPDLFARIKPTLMSLLPRREASDKVLALKPWVRVVVTVWVLAVIPIIGFSITLAVIGLPRILGTAGSSIAKQWTGTTRAFSDARYMAATAGVLATFAVALPAASVSYMFLRTSRRFARGLWRLTNDRQIARAALIPVYALLIGGLAWLWWPNGEYKPLHKGEKWTVQDTMSRASHVATGRPGLTKQRAAVLNNTPTTTAVPTTSTTVRGASDNNETRETTTTEKRNTSDTTNTTDTTARDTTETTSP
ncbi:MAG: putative peptide zinc metalloprotease protein [Actinomycetota bacterium]